jgi:hypothetical protein
MAACHHACRPMETTEIIYPPPVHIRLITEAPFLAHGGLSSQPLDEQRQSYNKQENG